MNLAQKIKSKIAINDSYALSMRSLFATVISGILAYHLLIIHGFTNPDGICEGLTFYTGAEWALAGCGRWAIRYMNEMTCNIVIPLYVVLMYCICIWLSVVLISKMWEISDLAIIVLSVLMITTPAVAEQLTYTYTALAYAFSCVLSVLFVYLVFRCKWIAGVVGGTLSVTLMMGLYQSYVGMVAVLVVMTLIVDLLSYKSEKQILNNLGICVVSSISGYFLYNKILEHELLRRGLDNSGTRVAEFSFSQIFEAFPDRLEYVYAKYLGILKRPLMHRNIVYWCMVVILIMALLICIYRLLCKKMFGRVLLIIGLSAVIPLASNIIGVLVPYNGVENYMQYQTILLAPFMFACIQELKGYKFYGIAQGIAVLVAAVLTWTFILGANATYKCYELSYKHINSQMQIAVTRVYDLDGFVKDETPILIAGFPNDTTMRNNMGIYQYAENFYTNPAFWIGMHGATQNRYLYFMNYFGIDAKQFSDDEYAVIVSSSQFVEMPVWPQKGSVAMIDGFAVVKFTEEPPMP